MTHKTERSAVSVLSHWMREIIQALKLDLGGPDVDTGGADRKSPDLIIYESPRSKRVLCVIEAKLPHFDVFNYEELKEPARKKAVRRKAPYFATTNFRKLIWFDTQKVNADELDAEQIVNKYNLSELDDVGDLEDSRFADPIRRELEHFLVKLLAIHSGKETAPKQSIDEMLIYILHEKIQVLSTYYRSVIEEQCLQDKTFAVKLRTWFKEQEWSFARQKQDFDKVARQTAYLLVNKILFYNLLQAKRPRDLNPLEIPAGLTKGTLLRGSLQAYFSDVLKIDYQTIYTTDFIDDVAFPDSQSIVREIKDLIGTLNRYDFTILGYDVLGRIFERLIPDEERRHLGQYFTSADVVDLILRFCMNHEDQVVLDPSCGAGTFLVRAYQHKWLMNQMKKHEAILDKLWGVDIAKFPAHLATINLAIRNLKVDKNYPNIIQEDFFALAVGNEGFDDEKWRKARARTLNVEERAVLIPRTFDAIVGNPPYTRQEDIGEVATEDDRYKVNLIKQALCNGTGKVMANIGKRAGIHAYFFVHGTKFLKEGGYFGFVVSNSWLDADYGKGLQEFFLNNYKIVAIIESKVERWFSEADINTCIVILQKCSDKGARDSHLVRFAHIKRRLAELFPAADRIWQAEIDRRDAIDLLKSTVLSQSTVYENENLRVLPVRQSELWKEGYSTTESRFCGSKWGKYLRAPDVFFRILEKAGERLGRVADVAEVRRGFTTGANRFFYLTEDEIARWRIEEEYWSHRTGRGRRVPNWIITSPRECLSLTLKPDILRYRVLLIHEDRADLKNKKVLKYIRDGERLGFHKRQTCKSRARWYDLGKRQPTGLLWPMIHNDRQVVALNPSGCLVDHNLFEITPVQPSWLLPLAAWLISSPSILFKELGGRVNLGEGALKTEGIDIERLPCIDFSAIKVETLERLAAWTQRNADYTFLSVFDEIGARSPEGVSLADIRPERRELDEIVMGEILGLSESEQLEVYRGIIDLVGSRLGRARSVGRRNKNGRGLDVPAFVALVLAEVGSNTLGAFLKNRVLNRKDVAIRSLPQTSGQPRIERVLFGWRIRSGKLSLDCESEEEARYLHAFLQAGADQVEVPEDMEYLRKIIPELEGLVQHLEELFSSHLDSILSVKTRRRLESLLWSAVRSVD